MIKFCEKCQKEKNFCPSGYYYIWKESVKVCPNCGGNFIDIDFPAKDLAVVEEISEDTAFIEAMIKLRQDDIIEYESRMSQFRTQVQQQEQQQKSSSTSTQVTCPYCHSTNVKKITATSKAGSVALWGIFSQKVRKNFHCNNCKSDF